MFRKGIALAVMLLFIGMAFTPTSGIDLGKQSILVTLGRDILYVGGTGTGNYSTIQEAIDDASEGDTVFVYNNSSPYFENVIVNKSINLIGEDKDSTVIDGNQIKRSVINISVDYVNISGFTIKNCSYVTPSTFAGIEMRSSYSTITDNNIVSNKLPGIYLLDSNYNNISWNNISKNRFAIIIYLNSEYNNISYNYIERGIHLIDNSHFNSISYNQIVGSSSASASIEIDRYCNNTQVHNNMLSKGNRGIMTYVNWETNISGNTIYDCNDEGIRLGGGWGEYGGRHIVYGNFISNCGGLGGIYCKENMFSNISHNYVSTRSQSGFRLYKANNNRVFDNVISSNRHHGIHLVQDSPDNMIFNNTINSNEAHGIFIEDSSPNQNIFCNTINSNDGHGIYINGSSSNNDIFENNISSNNGYGIRIENYSNPSNNNIIYHNNLLNNTYNGYDNCDNNSWDNGTDDYRGSNQNIPGSDSIGDTLKNIYGYTSEDNYPLMYPWGEQRPVANYTYSIIGDGGLSFNGSSSYDRDGVIVLYEWDFDDGNNGQGVVVVHAYNESGTYDVTLTVTDDDGYQGSYMRSIEAEKNHPPTAPLIDGPIEAKAGKSHVYNFTSEDPELANVPY